MGRDASRRVAVVTGPTRAIWRCAESVTGCRAEASAWWRRTERSVWAGAVWEYTRGHGVGAVPGLGCKSKQRTLGESQASVVLNSRESTLALRELEATTCSGEAVLLTLF